jgi:hypothetical protein
MNVCEWTKPCHGPLANGRMRNWLYIITCKKCGYISTEKLPELKAKEMITSHLGGPENCTIGHIKLMKVRA